MIPSALPKVSIFIPTFNDRTDLLACLESIRQIDYPKDKIEIIVWDNASSDDTAAAVRPLFSEMESARWMGLKLIEWDKNEGSYIPYNLVQEHLSPESQYILGLDADVELSGNTLIDLVNAAQEDRVAAVGARSVYYDNPTLTSHGAGFVNRWTGFYGEKDPETGIECDYVIGCCWLLNRNIFKLLGGFDPAYYINHWEVDYCLRAKQKGFRIVYEPGAIARHKIPLRGTLNPERVYYLYRNKIKLIKKTFSPTQRGVALLLNFTFGLSKAVVESVIRNRSVKVTEIKLILKAFRDGCLNKSGKVV